MLRAINIKWDIDEEEELYDLPTEIDIPEGMTDEDEICDYLSDYTGYCHYGFDLENIDDDEKIFKVGYSYKLMNYISVKAKNKKEALEKAMDIISSNNFKLPKDGEYLEDFIQINEEDVSEM